MKIELQNQLGEKSVFDGNKWTGHRPKELNIMQKYWWRGPSDPDEAQHIAEWIRSDIVLVEGDNYRPPPPIDI